MPHLCLRDNCYSWKSNFNCSLYPSLLLVLVFLIILVIDPIDGFNKVVPAHRFQFFVNPYLFGRNSLKKDSLSLPLSSSSIFDIIARRKKQRNKQQTAQINTEERNRTTNLSPIELKKKEESEIQGLYEEPSSLQVPHYLLQEETSDCARTLSDTDSPKSEKQPHQMLRLYQIAKQLNQPVARVSQDLTLRGNGRFFLRHLVDQDFETGEKLPGYYAFRKVNEVIVPYSLAKDYARRCFDMTLTPRIETDQVSLGERSIHNNGIDRKIGVLLGHFNHGKTSLLERLIKETSTSSDKVFDKSKKTETNRDGAKNKTRSPYLSPLASQNDFQLVASEKHGITQEVRTRLISLSSTQEITLIDTPGQDIFYRMRNLGAKVADFALLLIAVDDGIGPQTEESIGIIESLDVPVIVCLNKVDTLANGLDDEKLKSLFSQCQEYVILDPSTSKQHSVLIPISAVNRTNIDKLLEELRKLFSLSPNATLSSSNTPTTSPSTNSLSPSYLQARGQVLNVLTQRAGTSAPPDGTTSAVGMGGLMLHVILTHGRIRLPSSQANTTLPPAYFAAEGWAGRIVAMFDDRDRAVTEASAGQAVRLRVALSEKAMKNSGGSASMRPMGAFIHLYGAPTIERKEGENGPIGKLLSKKEREKMEEEIQIEAEEEMDRCVMSKSFEDYRLSSDEEERFRVHKLFGRNKRVSRYYGLIVPDMSFGEEEEDEIKSEGEGVGETEGENESEESSVEEDNGESIDELIRKRQRLVVVKASSDLEVGTIQDAYDDSIEAFYAKLSPISDKDDESAEEEVYDEQAMKTALESLTVPPPRRPVFTGTGVVSMHDVVIAKEAKATIIAYNVGVEKTALKEIQKYGLKVQSYDKVQDVIDFINNVNSDSNSTNKKKSKSNR